MLTWLGFWCWITSSGSWLCCDFSHCTKISASFVLYKIYFFNGVQHPLVTGTGSHKDFSLSVTVVVLIHSMRLLVFLFGARQCSLVDLAVVVMSNLLDEQRVCCWWNRLFQIPSLSRSPFLDYLIFHLSFSTVLPSFPCLFDGVGDC